MLVTFNPFTADVAKMRQ